MPHPLTEEKKRKKKKLKEKTNLYECSPFVKILAKYLNLKVHQGYQTHTPTRSEMDKLSVKEWLHQEVSIHQRIHFNIFYG